ncbi:hypothetical protein, partial [Salmonella enterica]|uniref:hypothetical protein n=1 Tax=Salmonella enterica TaxID=28901 RepID=UPI001C2FE5B6
HNYKGRLTRGCNPTSLKFIHKWLRFGESMRGSLSTKHHLKTARKTVLFTKGLLPARAHSNGLPAPDELLIKKRASIRFQTALSGL